MWNETKFRKNLKVRFKCIEDEILKYECEDLLSDKEYNKDKIAKLKEEKDALKSYLKNEH